MSKVTITERMTILEVLQKYPRSRKVFDRHGMGCRGCMGAAAETIAAGAITHGIEPRAIIEELKKAAREKD